MQHLADGPHREIKMEDLAAKMKAKQIEEKQLKADRACC